MARLTARARSDHPGKPLILLGHSMGSFATQLYLLDHSRDIDGVVISGSAALDQLAAALPTDPDAPALENFNATFEPARTPFDWLSRDTAHAIGRAPVCTPVTNPQPDCCLMLEKKKFT